MKKTVGFAWKPVLRRWSIPAALLLLLLVAAATGYYYWPDPAVAKAVAKAKELQQELLGKNSSELSVQERQQKWLELAQVFDNLTAQQRRRVDAELAKFSQEITLDNKEIESDNDSDQAENAKANDNSGSSAKTGVNQTLDDLDKGIMNYASLAPEKKLRLLDTVIDEVGRAFDKLGGKEGIAAMESAFRKSAKDPDQERMKDLDQSNPAQRNFEMQFLNDLRARCTERGLTHLLALFNDD